MTLFRIFVGNKKEKMSVSKKNGKCNNNNLFKDISKNKLNKREREGRIMMKIQKF